MQANQIRQQAQAQSQMPGLNDYELQIRTAKQYPRNINTAIDQAKQLVTMTPEVAQDCIYSLPRGGDTLTGPSVRFAEILFSVWGNSRALTRVTHMDKEFIYASADFIDLELNNAIRIERRRRIVNSQGNMYNADMIQTTGNAASSIAMRQAILQGIPAGYWQSIYDHVQQALMGDKTLSENRQKIIQALAKYGVTVELICVYLSVESVDKIKQEHLSELFGLGNALKQGDTTAEEIAEKCGYQIPNGKGAGVQKQQPAPQQESQVAKDFFAAADAAAAAEEEAAKTEAQELDES